MLKMNKETTHNVKGPTIVSTNLTAHLEAVVAGYTSIPTNSLPPIDSILPARFI